MRRGITCLEIQVSLVVLGIALAGICPLAVMQLKLLRRFESTPIGTGNTQVIRGQRLLDGVPYTPAGNPDAAPTTVLQPSADLWTRRLGTPAPFRSVVATQPSTPLLDESSLDDPSATYVGVWAEQAAGDAYGGSYRASSALDPGASATWSFGPINAGRYRVMVAWPPSLPIPPGTAFTVLDASAAEVASGSPTRLGDGPWLDLGNYNLGVATTVRVRGPIGASVVADGARIGTRSHATISALPGSVGRRALVVARP